MRAPPFLLGSALLFWAWQSGLFWIGIPAAIIVEIANWLNLRWDFTQPDLDRVWNLCVALFLGATVYAFFSGENLSAVSDLMKDNSASARLATLNQSKRSLFQLLQWLPIMFLPIALVQAYGEKERFDLSTFSWWLRRKRAEPGYAQRYPAGLNVSYPFFACCVFSASTCNQRSVWFSAALMALVAWALWLHRSRSFGLAGWTASLIAALGLGIGLQFGMIEMQRLLQRLDEALLARWSGNRSVDAKENQTRIGSIGRLKLSGRIVLRVTPKRGAAPELLREASYNAFHSPFWSATKRDYERVNPEANSASWILQSARDATQLATIAGYLPGGTGLLALPHGAARLEELPALNLATNIFGSVRVEDGPGFVEYDTAYRTGGSIDSEPTDADREIPPPERAAIAQIAQALQLSTLPPREAASAVERFFADHFSYSTWQGWEHRPNPGRTALARFLLEHRSGHCEYFGTATALLLRAANIPTRYAIGYSVQERTGHSYVVRERHGHAWCLAWIDGRWHDIDTTPASWGGAEAQRASLWEPVRDLFARLWFEFSRWRWGHTHLKQSLLWLVLPLLAFAVAKVLLQRQWGRARSRNGRAESSRLWPGLDSEFYAVEKRLAKEGFPRLAGETVTAWLERLRQTAAISVEHLLPVVQAHYRLRFHPQGLSLLSREQLRRDAEQWLRSAARRPRPAIIRGQQPPGRV